MEKLYTLLEIFESVKCLVKIMLFDPNKIKIVSQTFNCMFIRYVEHSVANKFLFVKSDVLDYNTIQS